ncbi:MAG: anthranilate/aminodeoxychorismate synthase component II [Gammaproteobacteria bacterium 39-13]|jgi:anthranilate synthase/aminodeoxychorismate synthase-like glutamine amidotransferase|nr:aminodeoxychorismate/anthranilate synthase component II [Gammaproteobacteria bacterium]OJV85964.1 MAG: anthranilate/aminodeoxychorismate synthase component II [Gammaproteobacteria bacterium 39-13]
MILLIDNYDSFVFNLARYVAELGHEYVVYRNDKLNINDIREMAPSHIIISPGPCSPNEAGISLSLIEHFKADIPILGVCLGHQAIAQACGGRVVRATYPKHGKADKVYHQNEGIFRNIPSPFTVGRYHSLIVENESLPMELKITALTKIGEIMALQHRVYPIFGVQFHPESVLTEHGHTLLSHFLQSAAI